MEIRPHAQADPDKPAIIMHPSGTTVSFGVLEARANRLARFFRQAGLREGDTIAVVMENNAHLHALMWAARWCGLYYALINPHLTVPEAPKVLDAAVFGIPDEDMGQSVKAAVQNIDAADATDAFAAELLHWLRDRLAHYKCPRSIAFEVQLPRTDTGKLYKQELVKKYSVPSFFAED